MNRHLLIALTALGVSAASVPVQAQLVDLAPSARRGVSRLGVDAGLLIAQPIGEFKHYVNAGVGLGTGLTYALDERHIFSLRADLGFLVYGNETKRVALSPTLPRIRVDVNTTNNIFFYSVGPQLMAPSGVVRPYANGFVGGAYFATSSSINGTSDFDGGDHFSTQHFGDGIFSYGGGGGVLIPLRVGRTPVAIDLGATFMRNGRTRYLREGSISDNPDGTLTFTPIESETNLVAYRLGVSVGVR